MKSWYEHKAQSCYERYLELMLADKPKEALYHFGEMNNYKKLAA